MINSTHYHKNSSISLDTPFFRTIVQSILILLTTQYFLLSFKISRYSLIHSKQKLRKSRLDLHVCLRELEIAPSHAIEEKHKAALLASKHFQKLNEEFLHLVATTDKFANERTCIYLSRANFFECTITLSALLTIVGIVLFFSFTDWSCKSCKIAVAVSLFYVIPNVYLSYFFFSQLTTTFGQRNDLLWVSQRTTKEHLGK